MHNHTPHQYYPQEDDPIPQQFDIKNQYSTYMEDLQQTTQKLMQEVFEAEYQPQIDIFQQQNKIKDSIKKFSKGTHHMRTHSNHIYFDHPDREHLQEVDNNFDSFILRNRKWCEQRQKNIDTQRTRLKEEEVRQLTLMPEILRGSRQKLEPIYERTLQLHSSKQKIRTFKRIQQKKKEDEQINSYSFHPKINSSGKARTLQDYLKDKQEWARKKNQAIEIKKLQSDAKKYNQCTFHPQLVANQISCSNRKQFGKKQRVQQRLLRTLQKANTLK